MSRYCIHIIRKRRRRQRFLFNEDAIRAETDQEFATELLARAKESAVSPSGSISKSSTSTSTADDVTNAGEASTANGYKWPHEAILLLVEEFRKEKTNLVSGKRSQKRVWERIAQVLQSKGHKATGLQCLSKFNGMKRTYKSIKYHNGRSGNNYRAWPYLDLMESVLGEKPFMQPVATLSSTGTGRGPAPSQSEVTPSSSPPANPRKRKGTSDIAEAILESRSIAEEGRDRRHRERMEEKRAYQERMSKMLGDLIDKI